MQKLTPDPLGLFTSDFQSFADSLTKVFSIQAGRKLLQLCFERTGDSLDEFKINRSITADTSNIDILIASGSTNDFATASWTMKECFPNDPRTASSFQITLAPGEEFEVFAASSGSSALKVAGFTSEE